MTKEFIADWFKSLQDNICEALEKLDGKATFEEDAWERTEGGGGRTRLIQKGNVIEKGGVNFSAVHGKTPAKILNALKLEEADFFATGVSIVLHPQSPHVPIIHMNVRYFEMSNGIKWFGGGIDLTPHYVQEKDAAFFHQALKNVCDSFDAAYYTDCKKWADDYFFIKHRNETRGIGGIFFDRLYDSEKKEMLFNFTLGLGQIFISIYCNISRRQKEKTFSDLERDWQLLRRGRYAEFNLALDRGTKFGLETNGRIESILMSLPPVATWKYNHTPVKNSAEYQTLKLLKKNIDWIKG